MNLNLELIRQFEQGLDPRHPDRSAIPARVLGYGEISTVLEIGTGPDRDLAYKRLPMFRSEAEAASYEGLYGEYCRVLEQEAGLRLVPGTLVRIPDPARGRVVVYIVQEKVPAESIGNQVVRRSSPAEIARLVRAVLGTLARVFAWNAAHRGRLEVGVDGQISNWAVLNAPAAAADPRLGLELAYFDTSTPLMQKQGREQLDPLLFLRSAPSFLVWVIRALFLQDVMTRYYDFRRVTVDLIANFYKEGRPEVIPDLVAMANEVLAGAPAAAGKPITPSEVASYYREDAFIWRFYLAARKIDRELHRLTGRLYPYILPETIQR